MKYLLLTFCFCCNFIVNLDAQTTERFFRQLMYNHVSPHVPIKGIHEISGKEAQRTSHYIFRYDKNDRLIEIINHHYFKMKQHPLASIGAHRVEIVYEDKKETRMFFDKVGKPMTNNRGVFKEEYLYDQKEFKHTLNFYDEQNQPMESNWKISKYQWEKNKDLVIERRYNLKNEMVDLSPYFEFGITGILYGTSQTPKTHFNLNQDLTVVANSKGIAAYQDVYDEQGNHIQYSYHDEDGNLMINQWNFAIGRKEYDDLGNNIILKHFDTKDSLLRVRNLPSNVAIKLASKPSSKDSSEIKRISEGYLIALQELKPKLMAEVFHPELAKRTPGFDRATKKENIRETTYEQMLEFAKSWNRSGTKFPQYPTNEVVILDIYDRLASVKLISDNWVEYLHLVKTNEEWDIINLLWQHKDSRRYK